MKPPPAPLRLLLVDDDESMRMLCRRFFERSTTSRRIEVTEAESGERAVELLAERDFDCILADYRMGAITGVDVLVYALRTRPKAVRIMMTGFASQALEEQATRRARVHEFFEKPMRSDELDAALRERVLERYLLRAPPTGR